MSRHYSKVIVELPGGPADPPVARILIDCDVCGVEEYRLHVLHLGTVLRVLSDIVAGLGDDGVSEALSPLLEGTPANKRKAREYLDRMFPGWKADRLRHQ